MDENPDLRKGMDRNLYIASERGDAKLLDQVLEDGKVDVFAEVTPMGDTALHTAAFHGHTQLVRKLIQLASDNPEAGKQFLKAQNDTDKNTALHVAAKRGFVEIVKLLVKKDKDMACEKNNAGETALFKACEDGNVGMVECLLECTPESEELDRRADGQTPLHVAVSELHEGVTTKLLDERPALADKADVSKMTALHMLALVPFALVPASWKEMWSLVVIRRIATMLLNKDISLMYRVDANGQSALHLGSKAGNSLVRNIISRGTDCSHTVDNEGRTALHVAVENASRIYMRDGRILREIILLLASSRLIDCSDGSGETALDIAIRKTEDDPQLFLSIRSFLRSKGARAKTYRSEINHPRVTWRMDIVSLNAVLIATVAFAAAFTLPGSIDTNAKLPVPFLLNVSLFKLFVIFDTLAFCSSFCSAVLLIFALHGNQPDRIISSFCIHGLMLGMICIALTFGAAIHLVVADKCLWLAVLVWIIVCLVPIRMIFTVMRGGKLHLFTEFRNYTVLSIAEGIGLAGSMVYDVGMPVFFFVAFIWGYLIVPPYRMFVRMFCWTRKKWLQEG